MKKIVKASAIALAVSFALPGVATSFANSSSPFSRSSKYSSAYNKLTSDQQKELDAMNTDGRAPLTLKELEAYGKYSTPIVKGVDWLYPFMYDKDGDGMVGEGASRFDDYKSTSSKDTSKSDQPTYLIDTKEEIKETTEEKVVITKEVEETTSTESKEDTATSEIEKILETSSKIDALSRLEEAVAKAQFQIDMAEDLLNNYPNTVRNVRGDLLRLIDKSKSLIDRANKTLGR